MKRDMIQGFIDGYNALGGDPKLLAQKLGDWMQNHPVYPQDDAARAIVLDDLASYRGIQG